MISVNILDIVVEAAASLREHLLFIRHCFPFLSRHASNRLEFMHFDSGVRRSESCLSIIWDNDERKEI